LIKSVDFMPRYKAERTRFTGQDAVISITDPGQKEADLKGVGDILRLSFLDETFTEDHAAAIVVFIDRVRAAKGFRGLHIHCEAGVSRSAAVALFAQTVTGCEFRRRPMARLASHVVLEQLAKGRLTDEEHLGLLRFVVPRTISKEMAA
jgi:predicted protein tyrosine phosphatase